MKGRYPFEKPYCTEYHNSHAIDPLWEQFSPIILRENHRQGDDKVFADILNRIARGKHNDEDLKILSRRVKPKNDPSVPEDALFIFSINANVTEQNENFLSKLDGEEILCKAIVRHNIMANFTPLLEKDGSIKGTPLQNELKLKIGAEVMLTYNIDVVDGLTNGAFGKIIGFEFSRGRNLKFIMIEFYSEKVGRERRNKFPCYSTKYPKATPIGIYESHYNIQNRFSTSTSKAIAINFPIKLSFAVTGHRVQGQTVLKPKYVVTDLKKARMPGQAYVMLSRVESMDQLIILDNLYEEKWRVSRDALEVVENIETNAINLDLHFNDETHLKILSLNIRSLKNLSHLLQDRSLQSSSLIFLQETWHQLGSVEPTIDGYQSHFNSGTVWRGNGICCFWKDEFHVEQAFWSPDFQVSKISNTKYDILNIYYKNKSENDFLFCLSSMILDFKKTILIGDFNINYNNNEPSRLVQWLLSKKLIQLVGKPTHHLGGKIDHVWIPESLFHEMSVTQKSVFYSDHDVLTLTVNR